MNKIDFIRELDKRGVACDEKQLNLLWDFMHHVLETNEKFNLTAIKDEESFVEKMLFDSALILNNQSFEGIDIWLVLSWRTARRQRYRHHGFA